MSNRLDHKVSNEWHAAINDLNQTSGKPFVHWLYRAKDAADEVPRMAMLFEMERNGKLAKTHHQYSHDEEGQPVEDNHLTCCMGVECRKCPFLLAFDKLSIDPAEIDKIKAWTCAAHILTESGANEYSYDTSEGFILTTDDIMYWQNVYASMAGMVDGDEPDEDEGPDEPDTDSLLKGRYGDGKPPSIADFWQKDGS